MKTAAFWLIVWLLILLGLLWGFERMFVGLREYELAGGALGVGALWGIAASTAYRNGKKCAKWLMEEAEKARASISDE